MPNMSYCRFENTLADLRDCAEALETARVEDPEDEEVGRYEAPARDALLRLCAEILVACTPTELDRCGISGTEELEIG
jgi:hypothetical protein